MRWTVPKRLEKLEEFEIGGREHPVPSTAEIYKNTEKSQWDLRGLAVTQTPQKSHYLITSVWKLPRSIIIIIIIIIVHKKREPAE